MLAEILLILNIGKSKTKQTSTWSVEARVGNNEATDMGLRDLPEFT
jgi:hypothetical protein